MSGRFPSPIETIRRRVSCRSFDGRPLDNKMKEKLRTFFRENTRGPFGNALRFELIDLTEAERAELKSLGTYGVVQGASLFIAGAVAKGARAMEDFGCAWRETSSLPRRWVSGPAGWAARSTGPALPGRSGFRRKN